MGMRTVATGTLLVRRSKTDTEGYGLRRAPLASQLTATCPSAATSDALVAATMEALRMLIKFANRCCRNSTSMFDKNSCSSTTASLDDTPEDMRAVSRPEVVINILFLIV